MSDQSIKMSQQKIHEFTRAMKRAVDTKTGRPWSDIEQRHMKMDDVLLDIAREVGCTELAEIFEKTNKLYV